MENLATSGASRPSTPRLVIVYGLMLVATVGLFLLIRAQGETLTAPSREHAAATPKGPLARSEVLLHVLLALATVIALGQLLGRLFKYLGQPPVIGEVVAGILLGPSFL